MKSYLSLIPRYLSAHKNKTKLTVISVAISVALITGVFSMLDVFLQFEKLQIIHDKGNFHLAIKNTSAEERKTIGSRIDVENAGRWKPLGEGVINNTKCELGALDEKIAQNFNIKLIEGHFPTNKREIMLEKWAMESLGTGLKIKDTVDISFADASGGEYVISGMYQDLGNMKAKGIPGVFLHIDRAVEIKTEKPDLYVVLFKNGVKIKTAEHEIKTSLNIADERVGHNEYLLAVIGQGTNKARGLYDVGAILFCLVLVAGVVMIYNTFNISVMERVRHFGLLRCIGASGDQIQRMVRSEGFFITFKAIPIGALAGMMITFVCSAILKFYNSSIFGEIPLFTFSWSGIGAGILIGFLTVFIATILPAKKAARVSPVNAVMGEGSTKPIKRRENIPLTKLLPVDISMGIYNATINKKTLVLMSSSIAISIILFLGFQVFVNFMHTSMKTTKPYTPDVSLVLEQGISNQQYQEIKELNGVKKVYGRMFGYLEASFEYSRLTSLYKERFSNIVTNAKGLFVPPEKSWLISYEENQLKWAKDDLLEGTLNEDELNEKQGIITVVHTLRNNVQMQTADLKLGDKVYINTAYGNREFIVMGILRSVPFSDSEESLTTFITTEKLFTEITGQSEYKIIDLQLTRANQEQTISRIKGKVNDGITFLDRRQNNREMDQTFLTMAVFIYGFVAVVALISILNIINTMNSSVVSKIRYFGVMRAVGISGRQLYKMVLMEAGIYSLSGCFWGCFLGIILQNYLITNLLSNFHIIWTFPLVEIVLIIILTTLMTGLSVISPLSRIRAFSISEVVNSL